MAESFDFQINDLKFRAATSDKFPYARATAPFRKEQFDAAPTVGDQSLSGWWTRGQLSFHKGAGVKYYEVLEGEEVLNRFADSNNVNPWEPGVVTLARDGYGDWELGLDTPTDLTAEDPASVAVYGGYMYALAGPRVWPQSSTQHNRLVMIRSGTPLDIPTLHASAWPISVAAGPANSEKVYVAVGNTIEVLTHTGSMTTAPTTSVLWTNNNAGTADDDFRSIFWGKGRLWAVDFGGNWYALSPEGGTIPAGGGAELFWASGLPSVNFFEYYWSFAETPGAIYVARYQYVYAISITDEGGTTPTIAPGVVAADLGSGEAISALSAHRDLLGINTENHFRLAQIGSGGGLGVGPIVHKWGGPNYTTSMATIGDLMYVGGLDGDNTSASSIYVANLNEMVDDLVPAFAKHAEAPLDPFGGEYTSGHLAVGNAGYESLWFVARGSTVGWWTGNYESFCETGTLTTGFHRFGTLDGKHFQELLVRVKGTDGSVSVARVDADGTETALAIAGSNPPVYNLQATEQSGVFDIGLSEPVERIALKFTLHRATDPYNEGVGLLGYQIKALPSPVRQRLIKWPLMIQDVVRDRYGVSRGTREGAWTAWSELEALEESDALVTFTDHRTGETGEAYIESLELQTDTPTQGSNSGFGGVGYITLRRV